MKYGMRKALVVFLWGSLNLFAGHRITLSLDGLWRIADTVEAERLPAVFDYEVPVPGLVHLATPPFPDVDRFSSREWLHYQVVKKRLPASAETTATGISHQNRNYFWYMRTFRAPAPRQVAILEINKAQFGTAVWLNGRKIGEHTGCFAAGYFDLTGAIDWAGENRLLVRVGAHPAVLPPAIATGTDQEKYKWTPGIYDSVSLILSDNPFIERVQVAPRIETSEILVQTVLKNYSAKPAAFVLVNRITTWKSKAQVAAAAPRKLALAAGEEKTFSETIRIPHPVLWSPENPFLYVLESGTGGDSASTRFGMREFRFDTATRRAWLNGKVYFMRGANITLHRFFEDPKSGALPWNEAWVRKLLVDIPKRMHWNSMRFCIGPVPDKWLDIADEAGLLIQNEYFIWTARRWHNEWDVRQLINDYREWMRDNWNHPSVAIWDACNETVSPVLANTVIPAVRRDDLSNRPWEDGYNLPDGPDDPMEDHPYLFMRNQRPATLQEPHFHMTELEQTAMPRPNSSVHATAHALINNEYGWLWLNRDGSPTEVAKEVWNTVLPNSTAEQRFSLYAYLLGGLTEYWRAHRNYAAVMYFVYLTSSYPGVYTSDNFRDVEKLDLEPHFADYVEQAFKPLGVYIDFWQPTLQAGARKRFTVMMINDDYVLKSGTLRLVLDKPDGAPVVEREAPFELPGLGQQTYELDLPIPDVSGDFLLKAIAVAGGDTSPTISRRQVRVTKH